MSRSSAGPPVPGFNGQVGALIKAVRLLDLPQTAQGLLSDVGGTTGCLNELESLYL